MTSQALVLRRYTSTSTRCAATGIGGLRAHLIGGNGTDRTDVIAPSAIMSVLSFVAVGAVGWRYRQYRAHAVLILAVGSFCLGVAFSVHAAAANTSPANRHRSSLTAEQTLFLLAFTFLHSGQTLFGRKFVARASLSHWPKTGLTLAAVILLIALIVGTVAFTSAEFRLAATSEKSATRYNQMRIASAVLELVAAVLTSVLVPLTKIVAPELPNRELGLLTASAWCLFVPALYLFCIATITDDSSPLVCSQAFFYLAFGFFALLPVALLLGVPSPQWGFELPARDLVNLKPLAPAAAEAQEAAAVEDWADEARRREAEEARLLREARAFGAEPDEQNRYDDWSLRLH
ncbi:hypothetical protein JCM3774_006612 [Rhodotorula dairenensis]